MSPVGLEFAVIGAQLAGTTVVSELLREHPDLWLPDLEERPVFSQTNVFQQGLEGVLKRQGTPPATGRLRGTVVPQYMQGWHDTTTATTAARMARALPDLKLIALLRDPIERARSQHRMMRARGVENRDFDEAVRQLLTGDGLSEGRFLPDHANAYVAQGEYGRILGEYLRYFARDSLHVELTSALETDPRGVVRRLLRFLGVSTPHWAGNPRRRVLGDDDAALGPIGGDVRDRLAAHYAADAEILAATTGLEAPWRAPNPRSARPQVAVYTAIAGGRDDLETPDIVSRGCDYICFTDNPYLRSSVWQLRPLELFGGEPSTRALRAKALAHRYLPEYAASVWVDANLRLRVDPAPLARRYLAVQPIAVFEQGGVVARRHGRSPDSLMEARSAETQAAECTTNIPDGPLTHWRQHASDRRASLVRGHIEDAHTAVLSPPKAGRSWVNYFLARYVAERTGGPFELDAVGDGRELPPVAFLHEHIDVFEHSPAPARLLNEDLLMRRRIVVLARDPRDSVVSYWHHKRLRERRPITGRLELFADCPVYGIERLSQGMILLLDLYDRHPGDKLLVTYEELVSEPARRLTELLRFVLDGRPLDHEGCRRAVEASRFERMREWERSLSPDDTRSRHANRFGPRRNGVLEDDHFKVRRGKVGAFRTEMSPKLRRYVASLPHTALLLQRLAARMPSHRLSVPRAGSGPAAGLVIWLTGLPAAGKSTIAALVAEELRRGGVLVRVLDGDALRRTTSRNLGFSRADRDEHVARTARLAATAASDGAVVIVALVSPFRAAREAARAVIGAGFREVYVRASLATCVRRDPKGLYRRALAREHPQFTGISDPYETPRDPALVLDTERESPHDSAARVLELVGLPSLDVTAIIPHVATPIPSAPA